MKLKEYIKEAKPDNFGAYFIIENDGNFSGF